MGNRLYSTIIMENYIVSARKYRPSTFESVVGQKALTTTLKNAISGQKLAHAYLFCGPRGVGKTTCARIFAKTINCMSLTAEGEACNECESCVAFNEQRSYNIHELDAASNNSVDDIRQLVEQVRIPPQIGKYKVYIIDEVHMLSASAFNAFLKTLEEPPKHAIFILATTEKHKILPTILSRCQIYDFNRISTEDTVEHLSFVAQKEGVNAEPEALNVIALKADGGMRDALSIFDQVVSFTQGNITYQSVIENLNVLDYDYYFRLTDYFLDNKVPEILVLFNDVLNNGFDGSHFITGLSSHLRDLLVSKDESTVALLEVGASIRKRYCEQAQKCPLPFLYRAMKLCNDCDLSYRNSNNKRLLVELTLIQMAQLTQEDDDISHGRSPKQIIKPIFTQPATAQPSQAAPAVSNSTAHSTNNAPIQPNTNVQASVQAGSTQPTANTKAPSSSKQAPDFIAALTNSGTISRSIPVMKKGEVSTSIKNLKKQEETKAPTSTITNGGALPHSVQEKDFPFDESELNFYWQEFAALLPIEHKSSAVRMQHMRVKLIDKTTFEAILDNEYVIKEFQPLQNEIEAHLRKQLRNRQVKMSIRISESIENTVPVGKVERFQAMAKKNETLLLLKKEFDLELW